ncbi:MAG: hypothetical protein FWC03_01475 [Treponema sp.]|nr:hypothetical protein [Treponema sp.]
MHKNVYPIIILISLFLIGLIALTQESDNIVPAVGTRPVTRIETDDLLPVPDEETEYGGIAGYQAVSDNVPDWVTPARWFRSNAGGMALEEIPSRITALRNEYALVTDFVSREELPEYLAEFYVNNFFIEMRVLYENGEETRRQWIFRDSRGTTRLIAVFSEPEDDSGENNGGGEGNNRNGFIEIFSNNGFITSEYRFFNDGRINRNDYNYNSSMIISASAMIWDEDGDAYAQAYADNYRYNRSSFLRSVERVFYKDSQISASDESIMLSFPGNIMSAAKIDDFISGKVNPYPEFFGDITVQKESRIVFSTDERGRVLAQVFYDEDDNIVWVIENTWRDDRIASVIKTENGVEYLAEYEYDSDGKRILERNLKDGVLERIVRTTGGRDIEDLYINNIIVLQAVWEDGRKISETRIR